MTEKEPLLVLVGPTASGKSSLALRAAERLGGEIVSADSVQVYRRFDVGSGKPSLAERERVPHHLIDVVEPGDAMDAARWARLAEDAIVAIRSRGKVPIVCGGTYLWVRALLLGLVPAPPADDAIRARHAATAESEGRGALHAELARVDPESARKLAPNDFVRVSRALEVHELTGKPLSAWHEAHGFRERRHAARLVGVHWSKEALSARIVDRARQMLDTGFIDEVRALVADGHGESRAMSAVGYRQVKDALGRGAVDRDALLDEIVRATRVFARRQRTWLRNEPVTWLPPDDAATFAG
ncbi:MAG TPA: tRNA (adenosine(37)-N6)-dimethylallyltransferase MiaA [Polyangiaceae bacterium]|jgi:tRNA dimethylallyltransferase|nr:tRNA (adenosine(37)-N6)-dimethylallyltransferase MiaA [Polyangiaceae bacterium]